MKRVKKWAVAVLACASMVALGQNATPDESVPKDLRPLLAPRHSEVRLVVTRYNSDRTLLAGNYAGNAGGGGGRGGGRGTGAAADAGPPLVISTSRIARLKRFDMSW